MPLIQKKRLAKWAAISCLFAAAAAGLLVLFSIKGALIPCPLRLLTGFKCPGCGNTHALAALLRLRFAESISYNYAYPAEFAYLLAVYLRAAKSYVINGRISLNPKYPAAEYIFLALIIAWGITRNIIGI